MLTVEKSGGKYRLIEGGKNKISYLVITIGGGMPAACASFWARDQIYNTAVIQVTAVTTPDP